MSYHEIEALLTRCTGLNPDSIGRSYIDRVIRRNMERLKIEEIGHYAELVRTDIMALQDLVDEVMINETWFFRDMKPFDALIDYVNKEWLPASSSGGLNILSIPCSTGEEPYSIAMALAESGLSNTMVHIDAIDVSRKALAYAQEGIFWERSFRNEIGSFKEKYFHYDEAKYCIRDEIKSMVAFSRKNFLDTSVLSGAALYDVIFCRNMLIYFDIKTQEKAIAKIYRLLKNNGMLIAGHADSNKVLKKYFRSKKKPGAFAYIKKPEIGEESLVTFDPPPSRKTNEKQPSANIYRLNNQESAISHQQASNPLSESKYESCQPTLDPDANLTDNADLVKVQNYADQGDLCRAAELCQRYLLSHQDSVEANYLMGAIRSAQGMEGEACEYFRRAVYLEPKHYKSLVQLAAIAQLQGNFAIASAYRARARRVSEDEEGYSRAGRTND